METADEDPGKKHLAFAACIQIKVNQSYLRSYGSTFKLQKHIGL